MHVLHFIYLNFTASLYDGEYACFHNGSGEINKQTHLWNTWADTENFVRGGPTSV